jgi:hypothetical protein
MRIGIILLFMLPLLVLGQGRMVINNNGFVVIDNGAYVVIDNPATNAVATAGTGGNIVTENEFDRVKWNIGINTGVYVMPFTSATGIKIPFTVNITTAGTGAGNIMFSTYNGSTWDNNTYRPSDVTHMFDYPTGSVNNSDHVIDRFWIIDANGYTTKPSATLGFTYIDAEHTPVGNNIIEADLGAQRFNSPLGLWGDYLPVGAINTAANTVTGVPAIPADFFRSWTLSEISNPLAAELISFTATCVDDKIFFEWVTATETNTSEFHVEASVDGITYQHILTVYAAGNSVAATPYYAQAAADGFKYFRLVLENTDGSLETYPTVFVNCNNEGINAWVYHNPFNENLVLQTIHPLNPNANIYVYDVAGKIIAKEKITDKTNLYSIPVNHWSSGMYMLVVIDGNYKQEFKCMVNR